jgi:cysteinyl-tRNA synthetase
MAGSVGNVINVVDLLRQHDPETVRFLLVGTHYRSPIEYSEDRLHEVRRSLDGFYRFFERYQRVTGSSFYQVTAPARRADFRGETPFLQQVGDLRHRFLDCMDDDFNTGGAVGVLYELLTALNRYADASGLEDPSATAEARAEFERGVVVLRELSRILGVFEAPPAAPAGGNDELVAGLLRLLIDLRADLRKAKNYALADQIRQRLGQLGVTLEDRKGGTDWRLG